MFGTQDTLSQPRPQSTSLCSPRRERYTKMSEKKIHLDTAVTRDPDDMDRGRLDESNKQRIKSTPTNMKFNRAKPRLPFCEEYDGINLRKTSTISQSIVALLASQKKEQDNDSAIEDDDVSYKTTRFLYFDMLKDFREVFDMSDTSTTESSLSPKSPESGISCVSYSTSFDSSSDPFDDIHVEHNESDEVCSIDLEITHIPQCNRLVIKVVKAEDVTDKVSSDKLINSFVKVSMYHGKKNKKQQTKTVMKSRDPAFNHTFYFDNISENWMHLMSLRVQLYQKTVFKKVCIGEALIWLEALDLQNETQVSITESLKSPFL